MTNIKIFYIMIAVVAGLSLALLFSAWVEYDVQEIFRQESDMAQGPHTAAPIVAQNSGQQAEPPIDSQNTGDSQGTAPIPAEEQDEPQFTGTLPQNVHHHVPFTPQAPFANWDDRRYQNACEESSILMAMHWIYGQGLTSEEANQEIAELVSYEQANYGFYIDSSAEDTFQLIKDYYQYENVSLRRDVSEESIKKELASGSIIVVPVDGRRLNNPYFVPPGPSRHMLVIIGYDEAEKKFVTNDPGTRQGAGFGYNYEVLLNAVRDYESGDHLVVTGEEKVMIVFEPSL